MKRILLTVLTYSTLLMGMATCSSNEKTTTESKPSEPVYKKEDTKPKEKLACQDITTDQYLQNYNRNKSELVYLVIQILRFNLKLEESAKTYCFY